jgi:hypothetical protein
MPKFNKTVGPRTHGGAGNASGQSNDDASHMKASNMAAEGPRQRGVLTPDEVDQQIRRFFESGQPGAV